VAKGAGRPDDDRCAVGLFAVAENYPSSNERELLKLRAVLSWRKNHRSPRVLNDDVNTYNTRINQLPEVFLANMMP
jgi:hypothetical protein